MTPFFATSPVPWWAFALITSLSAAGVMTVNQHYKLRPSTLMLWRGFGVAAAFLPAAMVVYWPSAPTFYLAVGLLGLLVSVADRLALTCAGRYGAGATTRILPLCVWVSFTLWLILKPAYRADLFSHPGRAAGIMAALGLAVLAMLLMRKNPLSRAALLLLAPAIGLMGLVDVLNKTAMDAAAENLTGGVVIYGFLLSLIAGFATLAQRYLREDKQLDLHEVFTPQARRAGAVLVAFMIAAMASKNVAMHLTPNPAYVGMLALASPLWVAVWNRLSKYQDQTNPWAGLLFIASAVLLIVLTRT